MFNSAKSFMLLILFLGTFLLPLCALTIDLRKRETDLLYRDFLNYSPVKRAPAGCAKPECDKNGNCESGCYCSADNMCFTNSENGHHPNAKPRKTKKGRKAL